MSEHDTASDGPEHGYLGTALAELAASMPDDPYRVDGIHAKARRIRNRRRAVRVTAGVATGVVVVAGLVVLRPGPTHVSTTPAGQPTTSPLPSCAAVLTTAPSAGVAAPVPAAAAAAKRAAANADAAATVDAGADAKRAAAGDESATTFRGTKGLGTIESIAGATVTITNEEQGAGQPATITATVSPTAEFRDGETIVTALPPLHAGDRVAFAATQSDDGSYQLIFVAVHVPELPTPTAGTVDPAAKASGAADTRYAKAMATVVSVQPGSVTLDITGGDLAPEVLTAATGPDTLYTAVGQKCLDPALSPGQAVGALLVRGGDGSYAVQEMALLPPG